MNKGEQLYSKAQEYKQKYLFNKKNNKKLFTESYKEKTKKYLTEAVDYGHAQAAYELAVYYSNGTFEATTFKYPKYGFEGVEDLKIASQLGHVEACYEYAMYLLRANKTDNERYNQALRTLRNGREQDYIPLALYYAHMSNLGYCQPIEENNFFKITHPNEKSNKEKLFELLDQHKPELNEKFIHWEFNLEYCDSLVFYKHQEKAQEVIAYLVANEHLLNNQQRSDLLYIRVDFHCSKNEDKKAVELLKKENSLKSLSMLADMTLKSNPLSFDFAITDKEVFDLYKKKLFDSCGWNLLDGDKLPSTYQEILKYKVEPTHQILNYIANALWTGKGVQVRKDLAFLYFKALEDTYYHNYERLGDCYLEGHGTTIDYKKALEYYEKVAITSSSAITFPDSKGDLVHYNIVETHVEERARCYYGLKEYDKAFPLFKQLAQTKYKDNPPLWFVEKMGYMYFYGQGTPVNYQEAKKFYEIGSKYKSSFCYYMLGELAIKTNNTNLAYNYYMKANGIDGSAKSKIGECYEFGYGVAIDLEKAKEWYEKAVSNKDRSARDKLYRVKQKIKKLQEEKQEEQEMKKLEKAMEEFAKSAEELKNVMENGGADVIADAIVNGKQNKSVKVSTKESTKNVRGALDSLIGLEDVKERVEELEDQIVDYNRRIQRGLPASKASMHMVFTGNAGTGKTTVARIIADILKANGIVSKGQLIETDRAGLIGEYIGETGQKTRKVIESAIGGVLFIDEAYALAPKDFGKDYGNEAIAVLLKMMEDYKDDLVVIVAGYKTEMKDFIDANPGLKSRFTTYIDFPDYKENELTEIFKLLASKDENVICEDCFEKLNELWKQAVQVENFGNGRAVRNIYNDVVRRRSRRLRKIASPTNEEMLTILPEDIPETFVYEIK